MPPGQVTSADVIGEDDLSRAWDLWSEATQGLPSGAAGGGVGGTPGEAGASGHPEVKGNPSDCQCHEFP